MRGGGKKIDQMCGPLDLASRCSYSLSHVSRLNYCYLIFINFRLHKHCSLHAGWFWKQSGALSPVHRYSATQVQLDSLGLWTTDFAWGVVLPPTPSVIDHLRWNMWTCIMPATFLPRFWYGPLFGQFIENKIIRTLMSVLI